MPKQSGSRLARPRISVSLGTWFSGITPVLCRDGGKRCTPARYPGPRSPRRSSCLTDRHAVPRTQPGLPISTSVLLELGAAGGADLVLRGDLAPALGAV